MSESSNWESDASGIWEQDTQPGEEEAYRSKIPHLCEWFKWSDPPENEGQLPDLNAAQNTEETVKINHELSDQFENKDRPFEDLITEKNTEEIVEINGELSALVKSNLFFHCPISL